MGPFKSKEPIRNGFTPNRKEKVKMDFRKNQQSRHGNGQLKPAYNLQRGVDSEYITWLTIGSQPTDTIFERCTGAFEIQI